MNKVELWPFQEEDTQRMVEAGRILNFNHTGTGKTYETLEALSRLNVTEGLIVVPKKALYVWSDRMEELYGWRTVIYDGTPKRREKLRREYELSKSQFLITNPAKLKEISLWRPKWQAIVGDEVNEWGLLNRKTQAFKIVKKLTSDYLFLLTATPVRKDFSDLWTLLHLICPKDYTSYWRWIHRHGLFVQDPFAGKKLLPRVADPEKFQQELASYMILRKKRDVLKDLPPLYRSPVQLEMSSKQKRVYKDLVNQLLYTDDSMEDIIIAQNKIVLVTKLRQLLVCPKILGIDDYGTGVETLCSLIDSEFRQNRSVAISTWYRRGIPYIEEALRKAIPDVHVYQIHGQIKEPAKKVSDRFMQDSSVKKVMIFTTKSGSSWDAQAASTIYHLGCSYSGADNEQAEGRLERIGQQQAVHSQYLLYKDTVDEKVVEILKRKIYAANWTLNIQEQLDILRRQSK